MVSKTMVKFNRVMAFWGGLVAALVLAVVIIAGIAQGSFSIEIFVIFLIALASLLWGKKELKDLKKKK